MGYNTQNVVGSNHNIFLQWLIENNIPIEHAIDSIITNYITLGLTFEEKEFLQDNKGSFELVDDRVVSSDNTIQSFVDNLFIYYFTESSDEDMRQLIQAYSEGLNETTSLENSLSLTESYEEFINSSNTYDSDEKEILFAMLAVAKYSLSYWNSAFE